MKLEEKATLISKYIQEWLHMNSRIEAKLKDVINYLVKKGIYRSDNRQGNPLKNDLRKLDKRDLLNLIEGLEVRRKDKNTYWYFKRVCKEIKQGDATNG